MPRPKEIAGGKYNNLLNLKTAVEAQRIMCEERPEYFECGIARLSASGILGIVAAYLSALTRFEEEQKKPRKEERGEEETERISNKDIGWFPGDCCD